ncbi:MAG: TRAP transporter large permease [Deltaproteobacteria bacterium]|jgi:C4-dicarboxylate transporter DctM subunit|nr:TRAP transporter large permease [Deltaproteobacteria bacterium]
MAIFLFCTLAVLLALSVPIFVCLSATVVAVFILFSDVPLMTVVMRMFAGIDKFALMSIPFFVLAANLMSVGGISRRIINLANALVGSFHGGLAIAAILASMFFGAISGSSPATVVAIGALLFPAMLKEGYPKPFATGLITSAGSLGIIIPPSVNMIVYGAITGVSVGALFVSGFGAGVVFGASLILYAYVRSKNTPGITRSPKVNIMAIWDSVRDAAWGLGVPIIIIGGIYGGVFTPTEAAAVAVIYAFAVSTLVYREITVAELYRTLVSSAATTAQVMIVLAAASVFAWILTAEGITRSIAENMLALSQNPYMILLMINIIVLVAGMFIDGASITTILAPLFLPIAISTGIDPVHLGIVIVVNSAIGMFTPPFGLNLFVATGVTDQPLSQVTRGIFPFVCITIVALMIITYIPEISLWLPRQVYGSW